MNGKMDATQMDAKGLMKPSQYAIEIKYCHTNKVFTACGKRCTANGFQAVVTTSVSLGRKPLSTLIQDPVVYVIVSILKREEIRSHGVPTYFAFMGSEEDCNFLHAGFLQDVDGWDARLETNCVSITRTTPSRNRLKHLGDCIDITFKLCGCEGAVMRLNDIKKPKEPKEPKKFDGGVKSLSISKEAVILGLCLVQEPNAASAMTIKNATRTPARGEIITVKDARRKRHHKDAQTTRKRGRQSS